MGANPPTRAATGSTFGAEVIATWVANPWKIAIATKAATPNHTNFWVAWYTRTARNDVAKLTSRRYRNLTPLKVGCVNTMSQYSPNTRTTPSARLRVRSH